VAGGEAKRAVETVWRIESARLIAGLARMVGDVGFAEDLAQDALLAAIEKWPESGVPENPGAWLMATAKNRAIDLMRREKTFARKQESCCARSGPTSRWTGPISRRRSTTRSATTCSA